jgi:hypothetical protein
MNKLLKFFGILLVAAGINVALFILVVTMDPTPKTETVYTLSAHLPLVYGLAGIDAAILGFYILIGLD